MSFANVMQLKSDYNGAILCFSQVHGANSANGIHHQETGSARDVGILSLDFSSPRLTQWYYWFSFTAWLCRTNTDVRAEEDGAVAQRFRREKKRKALVPTTPPDPAMDRHLSDSSVWQLIPKRQISISSAFYVLLQKSIYKPIVKTAWKELCDVTRKTWDMDTKRCVRHRQLLMLYSR